MEVLKRIVNTLLFGVFSSFACAFFICITHALLANLLPFISNPAKSEILWVTAAAFTFFLISYIVQIIKNWRHCKEDKEFKKSFFEGLTSWEDYQEMKQKREKEQAEREREIEEEKNKWRYVDTKPTFKVGDCYRMYETSTGKWRTIKVRSIYHEDGLIEITIDDDSPILTTKDVVLHLWKETKKHKINQLKKNKDLRFKKDM